MTWPEVGSIPLDTKENDMAVKVGDRIPDVQVHVLGDDGMPKPVNTTEVLGSGKVVLFAVPGAFTPGCSQVHLPGYVKHGAELRAKGVSKIVCISVNDPWVMAAWAKAQGADDIVMLADGAGAFTNAMGLALDGSGFGLGMRSQRYAAIINNGVIAELNVEAGPGIDVSACEVMMKKV
ncbi:MAG: hypothetical protein RL219_806 [Actinomycetota bacterium]